MSPLKTTFSFFVVCAAALVFCGSAGAVSLVTNGGFETGDFTGWSQTGSTTFNGVQTPGPSPFVHSGNSSAFFGPVGSVGGISQNLVTIPGASYIVDFWLKPDGGTPNFFSATFGATTLISSTNLPDSSLFTEYAFVVNATGTTTALAFNFRDDPGFMFLDDVSVNLTQTPLPAALPLFATGLGALGLLRWRRKRKSVAIAA